MRLEGHVLHVQNVNAKARCDGNEFPICAEVRRINPCAIRLPSDRPAQRLALAIIAITKVNCIRCHLVRPASSGALYLGRRIAGRTRYIITLVRDMPIIQHESRGLRVDRSGCCRAVVVQYQISFHLESAEYRSVRPDRCTGPVAIWP